MTTAKAGTILEALLDALRHVRAVSQQLVSDTGEEPKAEELVAAAILVASRPKEPERTDDMTTWRRCPKCGGPLWDNRAEKTSGQRPAKSPDFKCKDCGWRRWARGDRDPQES